MEKDAGIFQVHVESSFRTVDANVAARCNDHVLRGDGGVKVAEYLRDGKFPIH